MMTVQERHRFRPPRKVVMFGCGSVAQCLLALLLRHLDMDFTDLTVVDAVDRRGEIGEALAAGVQFRQAEITRESLWRIVPELAGTGDIIIDLTYDVGTIEMIEAAREAGAMYVNASVEDWDDGRDPDPVSLTGLTLYQAHEDLASAADGWAGDDWTAIVSHGANPGMVSSLTKRALEDLAEAVLKQLGGAQGVAGRWQQAIEAAADAGDHARIAQATGVQLVQVSEQDTQISGQPREWGEFCCTWSPLACLKEALQLPAEIGLGTHETHHPYGTIPHPNGSGGVICLNRPGADVWARSWAPHAGPFTGVVISHDETVTLAKYLTVRDEGTGRRVYAPTNHYVYGLPQDTQASLAEARDRGYQMLPRQRIVVGGEPEQMDELGVLLGGHDLGTWWYGSQLDVKRAHELVPGHGPTTVQVAGPLLAAIGWAIEHPRAGLCHPEDLDHRFVLDVAGPYWEPLVTAQATWDPLTEPARPFATYRRRPRREADRWRFAESILVA